MITKLSYTISMKQWDGQEIRAFRAKLGLTQTQFGERLGITRIYVMLLEKGKKKPSKTLRLLLQCLEQEQRKEVKR